MSASRKRKSEYDDSKYYEGDEGPLHWALRRNMPLRGIRELIQLNPTSAERKNPHGSYPLHVACQHCDNENVVMKLLEVFPMAAQKSNCDGEYPLHLLCRNNIIGDKVLDKLIASFPRAVRLTNKDKQLALHIACQSHQPEAFVIKLIELYPMAARRKCYDGTVYPLALALSHYGNENVVIKLLDVFPMAARLPSFSLHIACRRLYPKTVIKQILEVNPIALHETWTGKYPIHFACWPDRPEYSIGIIKLLVEADPLTVNQTDLEGETVLHIASKACCVGCDILVEYLIQLPNIDINMKSQFGQQTPLHLACHVGDGEVVENLLCHPDIDVNATDDRNETPLHKILNGPSGPRILILQQLLSHPFILINERNNRCKTFMDLIKHLLRGMKSSYMHERDSYQELVEMKQLLNEFSMKRRWQAYQYFYETYDGSDT